MTTASDSILIRRGRVFDPGRGIDAALDVLVEGGSIVRIAPDISSAGAQVVVEATGCIVTPGFVDLHTHLREPGFEQKGTIATETAAALAGGFTTVCAMPNTEPAPDSAPVALALLDRIRTDAVVRVFPVGCVTVDRAGKTLANLGELAHAGCVAFSDDGSPVSAAHLMRSALTLLGDRDLPLSEHADDPEINRGGVMNEGRVSERLGLAGQPAAAEIAAVTRDIALAEAVGGRLHIAHVSTAGAVAAIAAARARGVRVTCEVTPSHLLLTEDAVFGQEREPAYDTNAKVNPPLRTEADRRALLRGLREGVIDAIATDHAPHAIEDKLCEFDLAAPGISCIETALSSLLALVERGELDLAVMVRALTSGPVAAWSLERRIPGLGSLVEGGPADVTVFDPQARWTVDPMRFISRGRNTPLAGRTLPGRVVAVVAGGALTRFALEIQEPAHA